MSIYIFFSQYHGIIFKVKSWQIELKIEEKCYILLKLRNQNCIKYSKTKITDNLKLKN